MDLDKIKDTWQKAEIQSSLSEEKIQRMISAKGQSAFNKLKFYENIGLIMLIPLFILSAIRIIWVYVYDIANPNYPALFFYNIFCVIGIWWMIKKVKFLKQVDFLEMNILTINQYVTTYRKYLKREYLIGFAWAIVFFIIYITNDNQQLDFFEQIITIFILSIITLTIVSILYLTMYKKHIIDLQDAINEVKYFEELENNK